MTHLSEDDLIAYHLQEASDAAAIARHLEGCDQCAALSDSIAETLRVFSADAVPEANVDHSWQRLRVNLPVLPQRRQGRLAWPGTSGLQASWLRAAWLAGGALTAALLLAVGVGLGRKHATQPSHPTYANGRPGPLTDQPVSAPGVHTHIDSAERLLTEVNHTAGPLDEAARQQTHALLLSNAVYVQQAQAHGDLAQASLLENLGRVLTALDHQDAAHERGWHLRIELHTDGLLLDLRMLQQNDQAPAAATASPTMRNPQ